jgi:hypothetical protein
VEKTMLAKGTAVFGIYPTPQTLEAAVEALRTSGFRNTDISFLSAENVGSKDLGHRKATKGPEGAVVGAVAGVVVGLAFGLLLGNGVMTISGFETLVVSGPVVAAMAVAGVAGAVGGLMGGLIGMTMPEYEALRYEGRVRKGGILLSVHCDDPDWTKRAREVLARTAAEDVAATGEATADFARSRKPIPRTGAIDEEKHCQKRDV